MVPMLRDTPFFHHEYLVRIEDGGQPVGDDHGRASLHQSLKGLLDRLLREGVHRGRGLVHYGYGGVPYQGSGYRYLLPLSL